MTALAERTNVFARRAERARELAPRHEFAAEPLRLYAALAEAQVAVFDRAASDRPGAADLPAYAARVGLPAVMDASMTAGTESLREAVLLRFHSGDLGGIVAGWLDGAEQSPTDAFLARSAAAPVLEALPEVASTLRPGGADERRCPRCGGLPQLAVFTDTGEALLTGQRRLVCSRCAGEWTYARMTCASCRETEGGKMPVLADESRLPHLRADACDTCRSYLVTVDLRKDPRAVPLVDELVALPLDLTAAERGYTKIARNAMGY